MDRSFRGFEARETHVARCDHPPKPVTVLHVSGERDDIVVEASDAKALSIWECVAVADEYSTPIVSARPQHRESFQSDIDSVLRAHDADVADDASAPARKSLSGSVGLKITEGPLGTTNTSGALWPA